MAEILALCIRCGHEKGRLLACCRACGFTPRSEEDKARALILSLGYEFDSEYLGKDKEELRAIGAAIRGGHPHVFDDREVRAVIAYARKVGAIPVRKLLLDGLRWLGPPLLLLVLVYLLILSKR